MGRLEEADSRLFGLALSENGGDAIAKFSVSPSIIHVDHFVQRLDKKTFDLLQHQATANLSLLFLLDPSRGLSWYTIAYLLTPSLVLWYRRAGSVDPITSLRRIKLVIFGVLTGIEILLLSPSAWTHLNVAGHLLELLEIKL